MGNHCLGSRGSALVLFGSLLAACYTATGEIDFVDHPGAPNGGPGTGVAGTGGGPSSGTGGAAGSSDPGTAGGLTGGAAGQAGGVSTGQGGTSTGQGGSGTGAGGSSSGAGGATTGAGGASTGAGGTFVPGPWCSVKPILQNKCVTCHSNPPLAGIPMPLVAYADLAAPAKSNPAVRVGDLVLARMASTTAPMPPRPATPATASEIQAVQAWISAGMKEDACTPPPGGGGATGAGGAGGAGGSMGVGGTPTTGGTGGGTTGNPFDTPTVCTSNRTMTGEEGATMRPGEACISCHTRSGEGEAPRFTIAGTVYPTAHEPNDCVSLSGSAGAQIVIIDANGRQIPLTVNSVGSFTYSGTVALPFQAKVTRNGLERVMSTPQTVGDCNSCHTPAGANGAPGRIMAP